MLVTNHVHDARQSKGVDDSPRRAGFSIERVWPTSDRVYSRVAAVLDNCDE